MASNTVNIAPMLLLGILILCASNFASARSSNSHEEGFQKPNNVVVKGSVFCDTQLSETAYLLPGALVTVECSINSNRKWKSTHSMVSVKGETNENGEFMVELPIIQNLNPRKLCSVRLLSSPHELCDIPSIIASSQLALTSSDSNGMHIYVSTPLSYRPSKEEVIFSSIPHRRALEDSTSKATSSPPPLPTIPPLPKFSFPPLPSIPPLPKLSVPPLPTIPPLNSPNVGAPPLPNLSFPPLPNVPTLPNLSVPPLPSIPTLPKLSVPPLPSAPPLPKFSVPPLPNAPSLPNLSSPPLNIPSIPSLPKLSFPPLPSFTFPSQPPPLSSFKFPPFPLFTPPPPSIKDETP